MHGSGALIRWLLDNDLVDELTLLIVPVVLGQGARLFPDAGPDLALDLFDSRADSKGVTIQVYRPAGRPGLRGESRARLRERHGRADRGTFPNTRTRGCGEGGWGRVASVFSLVRLPGGIDVACG